MTECEIGKTDSLKIKSGVKILLIEFDKKNQNFTMCSVDDVNVVEIGLINDFNYFQSMELSIKALNVR